MHTKTIFRHIRISRTAYLRLSAAAALVFFASVAHAQDGVAGINSATTLVKSYFPIATNLLYAIGGVVGIIGSIKVYNAWSHGDPNTNKLAAGWFSSCIFLVVVATVLKSFFGL